MLPSLKNTKLSKSSGFVPDYFVNSIFDIDFEALQKQGIKNLAIDVDQTLTHNHGLELDNATIKFLQLQKQKGYIDGIFIASNSFRDLTIIATALDAQVTQASPSTRKPMKSYYDKLLNIMQCKPHEAVMVGDRLLTDIWGGNKAGFVTILVSPLGKDLLIDKMLGSRYWGKRFLRKQRHND